MLSIKKPTCFSWFLAKNAFFEAISMFCYFGIEFKCHRKIYESSFELIMTQSTHICRDSHLVLFDRVGSSSKNDSKESSLRKYLKSTRVSCQNQRIF